MSLNLTDPQLLGIRELQELLVAPLRFPAFDAWARGVHERITDLFGVERSLLVLPHAPDEVRVHSCNLAQETLERLDRAVIGTRPEVNRYRYPLLDRAMRRLAATGLEAWNRVIAERSTRIRLEEMPRFFPEVVRPARLEGMLMMGSSLAHGRAMLGVLPNGPERTTFGGDAMGVLRLLLPAFKAGSRAHGLAWRRWRGLRNSLDVLEEGVAVYQGGAERYRNRTLRRLLVSEGRGETLVAEMGECADRLSRSLENESRCSGLQDVSTEVTTPRNRYRLTASHLDGGSNGKPLSILVAIRPAVPCFPAESELRERYALTERQSEVALLLAHGHSNREIAERLGISQHTARHHAQRALEKIGATSRKTLAIRLLRDRNL